MSELERVHYPATYIMMAHVLNQVQDLSKKFIRSSDETNEYIDIEWTDGVRCYQRDMNSLFGLSCINEVTATAAEFHFFVFRYRILLCRELYQGY